MNLAQGLRLASITLMNPDAPLASFVGGDGQRLAQLCQLVTVYGDRKDVALWGAAIVVGLHAAWVSASPIISFLVLAAIGVSAPICIAASCMCPPWVRASQCGLACCVHDA